MNKERQYVKNNSMPGIRLAPGTDLNELCKTSAVYYYGENEVADISNNPVSGNRFYIEVKYMSPGNCCQIIYPIRRGISPYVRYLAGGTWGEWTPLVESVLGITLLQTDNVDLNNITTPGVYRAEKRAAIDTMSNVPGDLPKNSNNKHSDDALFRLEVEYINSTGRIIQTLTPMMGGYFYQRVYRTETTTSGTNPSATINAAHSAGWTSWYKFTGTAVT